MPFFQKRYQVPFAIILMPRKPRCFNDGLIYHVLNRGNNKRKIFYRYNDFQLFLNLTRKSKKDFGIKIFAYCLMPNHFHIVLSPDKGVLLSKWMHCLMRSHFIQYKRVHETTGHLWQGRFKSFVIQEDNHLLVILRYVERNPVRANLVVSAKNWSWSSHQERIGKVHNPFLDNIPIELPPNWSEYVDQPLTDRELEVIRRGINRHSPFGNSEWKKKMSRKVPGTN